MDELVTTSVGNRLNPPCVSFKTFFNFIGTLSANMPARVDRSIWSVTLSGSNGKAVMKALHFLSLLDQHDAPTTDLKNFAVSDADGKVNIFAKVVRRSYGKAFGTTLSLDNATYDQLIDFFKNTYFLSKDDAEKCLKFLRDACKYANIGMSAFLRDSGRKKRASSSSRAVQTADKTEDADKTVETQKVVRHYDNSEKKYFDKLPDFDPSWPDELKFSWMEIYGKIITSVAKDGKN